MSELPLELAERALAHLDGDGQALVVGERSLMLRYARSAPTQATEVDDLGVAFLALHDGHVGTAETNVLDDDSLRNAARRAGEAATAGARAAGGPGDHPGLPDPGTGLGEHPGFDPDTALVDPAPGGAALRDVFAVTERHGLEAFGTWTTGMVETALASSTGIRAHDAVTDAFLKVVARRDDGRSGWGAQAAVGLGALDPVTVAERAAGKVVPGPVAELEPGAYTVVLAPDAVGGLLEMLGWLAFNGLAHAEGRGALVDRLGTRVAAPLITLGDSPRDPRTWPRAFDAEGVPKAPLPLIQDGVAHHVVHDTRSAARAGGGARSTGHALVPGGIGGPAPTNLVLAGGGAADEAALIAPVERGIYVTRLWYLNVVHPTQTLLTGTTRDGTFLIEDGRLAHPLRDVRFTDSVLRLLDATEALAATPQLVSEAEYYGRRFAIGVVCPALRAGGFRITG